MARKAQSKVLVFVASMSALGNVLSGISIMLTPFIPSFPLGPLTVSVALDLSHITTFLCALYLGPVASGLTGFIGGAVAAYEFGFSKGNVVNGLAIPIGKAITGVTAGLVISAIGLQRPKKSVALLMLTPPISYIPEAIYTAFLFLSVLPSLFGMPAVIMEPILIAILIKAWIEMLIIGWILVVLTRNVAIRSSMGGWIRKPVIESN